MVEADKDADASQPIESADYYLSCSGAWVQQWCSRNDFPSKVHLDTAEDFLALWRKLIYEKRNIHGDNAEMMDALIKVLCLTIERYVRKQTAAASRPELNIPYKMKQYLEKHATEPLTLTYIAERYGISVSTASHLFKQAFGQSPMRYVIEIRLSIASERILYSDMKLEDIAEASGFRSYPYFCRAFRAYFHASPSKYRVRNQLRKVENP
ncbi:helix-turn-helix domain-containing protein [Paenibacillus uliginis]|uniref:helix-turn-helix domain-containing protein n=1 Tax=Paenibacillus uliginis TaxID=683737 RepID=UPI001AD7F0BA|nr:AraC family transcriptional regulator [Paenibacillus uliginis]